MIKGQFTNEIMLAYIPVVICLLYCFLKLKLRSCGWENMHLHISVYILYKYTRRLLSWLHDHLDLTCDTIVYS